MVLVKLVWAQGQTRIDPWDELPQGADCCTFSRLSKYAVKTCWRNSGVVMPRHLSKLTLRSAEPDDIDAIFELREDRAAAVLAGVEGAFVSEEVFRGRMKKALEDKTGATRLYVEEVEGRFAGYVGCFKKDDSHSLSYWIARPFWGVGVGTHMLETLMEILPDDVTGGDMSAEVVDGNDASMRLLRHLGFERVGERAFTCAVTRQKRRKNIFRRPGRSG